MDIGRLMFSLQPTSFLNEAAIVPLEAADLLAWAGFGKRTSGSPASDRSHWSISEDVSQFGGILEASLFGEVGFFVPIDPGCPFLRMSSRLMGHELDEDCQASGHPSSASKGGVREAKGARAD